MTAPVPSLSANGWVSETFKKADTILGHFFVSEASQSNLYKGKVSSLPELVQLYGSDPNELAQAVESNVSALFNRYFVNADLTNTSVNVKAKVDNSGDPTNTRYELRLDAAVIIDGIEYSLGKIVNVDNSTIKKIIALNNG